MLQVVGAGLPRTGTNSLRLALQRLLGGECYHMFTVKAAPDKETPAWLDALTGDMTAAKARLSASTAAVDWPAAFFWRELATPRTLVILSVREDPLTWWRSFDATVLERKRNPEPIDPSFTSMRDELLLRTFGQDWAYPDAAMAAYERHNAGVRARAARLLEWHPADGWPPLCAALGVDPPDEAFPRTNDTAEFFSQRAVPARPALKP